MAQNSSLGPVVTAFNEGKGSSTHLLVCDLDLQKGAKYRGGFTFDAALHQTSAKRFTKTSPLTFTEGAGPNPSYYHAILRSNGEGFQEWTATLALINVYAKWNTKGSPRAFLERWFYRFQKGGRRQHSVHMQILVQKSGPPQYCFDQSTHRILSGEGDQLDSEGQFYLLGEPPKGERGEGYGERSRPAF